MPPTYYRDCWHVVSRGFLDRLRHCFLPCQQRFTIRRPSSLTRRRWVRLSPIAQYSPLLPPVDRISVPMWPFDLSVRLPIVGLVGRYLTNYLIGREPILQRIAPLAYRTCDQYASCGISTSFPVLSPSARQVAHALLTRPPLIRSRRNFIVRLECVKHAASVHPEPGSNSLSVVY